MRHTKEKKKRKKQKVEKGKDKTLKLEKILIIFASDRFVTCKFGHNKDRYNF